MSIPVFVYGTLRKNGGNYERILDGNTYRERNATFEGGTMLDGGGFPFVRLNENEEGTIVGELMWLAEDNIDFIMKRLDRLEGYRPNSPAKGMYDRVLVEVTTEDNDTVKAWMYVTTPATEGWLTVGLPVMAGGDWRNKPGAFND